jgi:hypothetical protein
MFDGRPTMFYKLLLKVIELKKDWEMKMKLEKLTATLRHSQDMFLRSFGLPCIKRKIFYEQQRK